MDENSLENKNEFIYKTPGLNTLPLNLTQSLLMDYDFKCIRHWRDQF